MTTAYDDIERTLAQTVKDCDLEMPTLFPNLNKPGKPQDGSEWAQVTYMYNPTVPVTLGDEGEDGYNGILQIDINLAVGEGTKTERLWKGVIQDNYKAGKGLVHGVFKGYVRSCSFNAGRVVDGYWRFSASIYWEGRAPRNP